jgi:hypothetical protein
MLTAIFCFFLGVFFAPLIRPLARPFFSEVVKLFVMATHEVRMTVAKVKEDMEDTVATAQAERAAKERDRAESTSAATPPGAAGAGNPKSEP